MPGWLSQPGIISLNTGNRKPFRARRKYRNHEIRNPTTNHILGFSGSIWGNTICPFCPLHPVVGRAAWEASAGRARTTAQAERLRRARCRPRRATATGKKSSRDTHTQNGSTVSSNLMHAADTSSNFEICSCFFYVSRARSCSDAPKLASSATTRCASRSVLLPCRQDGFVLGFQLRLLRTAAANTHDERSDS